MAQDSRLKTQDSSFLTGDCGQAMTEYAIISFALVVGALFISHFFVPVMMDAYQFYFDQFYFMLNLPIP